MAIILNGTELATLTAMRVQAIGGQIGYWEIYNWLANTMQSKGAQSSDQTVLWLRGATEANAGRGAMSALIRAYTESQYQLRYGTVLDAAQMQVASNAVASNLLKDLLGENPQWPAGQVPDITRIAFADATAVGSVLFDIDKTDTAAADQQNSAWSGALLFSLLGSDQTGRLASTGTAGAVDTLNDLRDVLYAAMSYARGLQEARTTYLTESAWQKGVDVGVLSRPRGPMSPVPVPFRTS